MRTTVILKDDLVEEAQAVTHIKEKTALIHEGLKALIAKHARERLAALGGSQSNLQPVPRRRSVRNKS